MKKLFGIIAIAVCLMSSVFSFTAAEKADIRKNIRNVSDDEIVRMVYELDIIDQGGLHGKAVLQVWLEDLTLEEFGFMKQLVRDEYKRRTNPSTKDKLLNKFDNFTDKIADKIYEDYNAVRKN